MSEPAYTLRPALRNRQCLLKTGPRIPMQHSKKRLLKFRFRFQVQPTVRSFHYPGTLRQTKSKPLWRTRRDTRKYSRVRFSSSPRSSAARLAFSLPRVRPRCNYGDMLIRLPGRFFMSYSFYYSSQLGGILLFNLMETAAKAGSLSSSHSFGLTVVR